MEEPGVKSGLSDHDQELLDNGNALIEWSAQFMLALWLAGGFFSLENPWPGYLWLQNCILAIHAMPGVILTNMSMTGYDMCYDKSTGLLHNMPFGWLLGTRKVREKIQVVLRGKVWFQGKCVYRTRLVEPYPLDLTDQYSEVVTL